jgi:hypothetical protein
MFKWRSVWHGWISNFSGNKSASGKLRWELAGFPRKVVQTNAHSYRKSGNVFPVGILNEL